MNLSDTRKRNNIRLSAQVIETRRLQLGGYCKYLDSLALEDKTYTATRKERLRHENKLGINGQGSMPEPLKKKEDYPQAVTRVQVMRQQAEKPSNPHIPHNRRFRQTPIEERQKTEENQKAEWKQWRWNGVDQYTILVITSFIFDWLARVIRMVVSWEEYLFLQEFRLQAISRRCVNTTLTPHAGTRTHFSRACGSRIAAFCARHLKNNHHLACHSCPSTHTPSATPLFGRFAEQSPPTHLVTDARVVLHGDDFTTRSCVNGTVSKRRGSWSSACGDQREIDAWVEHSDGRATDRTEYEADEQRNRNGRGVNNVGDKTDVVGAVRTKGCFKRGV